MSAVSPASGLAVRLLAELVRAGVRDVVVCPGSRSQALALAAAEAEAAGAVRLHVRIDERSAGFFALGLARESGWPAPVIVTSGTAVANLVPAAFEAHEGRVPLLALTADRPADLRGTRSNQTTRQAGIFADVARLTLDVPAPGKQVGAQRAGGAGHAGREPGTHPGEVLESELSGLARDLATRTMRAALGAVGAAPAGPVQLNLAFREPLSGLTGLPEAAAELFRAAAAERDAVPPADGDAASRAAARRPDVAGPDGAGGGDAFVLADDARTVVIAGADAGPEAEAFARLAGAPLLAEVVSGARFGREAIAAYAELLDDPQLGGRVERAVVFGHPTLTRQVPALLQRADVEVVVVDPHTGVDHLNPGRRARIVAEARVDDAHDPRALRPWLGAWVVADRQAAAAREERRDGATPGTVRGADYKQLAAYARAEVELRRAPVTRDVLTESVWRATWPHDRLVLAASRLVRVLDRLAPARRLTVHANRGLAGIDGTLATALGVASASQAGEDPAHLASTTRVLIGDVALLHDVGSLWLSGDEPRPRVLVLVGNDGGGTMFDLLEVAQSAPREAFDRVMLTPQRVDLASLAAAYGWEFRRVSTRGELATVLGEPVSGPTLVDVSLAR